MTQNLKKRPLGVVAVALFYLLTAISFIVLAMRRPEIIAAVASRQQVLVFGLLMAFALVIAMGLIMLLNWARYLMAIHLFLNGLSFILAGSSPFNGALLVDALLLAYVFLSPACKTAFADTRVKD